MKLSQLTPEQKTQMLAEMDGWTSSKMKCSIPNCNLNHDGYVRDRRFRKEHELSSYLTSYDAIIPLVQKQPKWIQIAIAKRFYACDCPVLENMAVMLTATPSQLCDAVLVATGKAEL